MPENATATRTVRARFRPQAWVNDYAVDVDDGGYTFDITDQVLALGRDASLAIEDDQYESDDLWHAWIAAHPEVKRHDGPFVVEVEDAIRAFWSAPQ